MGRGHPRHHGPQGSGLRTFSQSRASRASPDRVHLATGKETSNTGVRHRDAGETTRGSWGKLGGPEGGSGQSPGDYQQLSQQAGRVVPGGGGGTVRLQPTVPGPRSWGRDRPPPHSSHRR